MEIHKTYEEENKFKKNKSGSSNEFSLNNLEEIFHYIENAKAKILKSDPHIERSRRVRKSLEKAIHCYKILYEDEKKKYIFEPAIEMNEESIEKREGWQVFLNKMHEPYDTAASEEELILVKKEYTPEERTRHQDQIFVNEINTDSSLIKKQKFCDDAFETSRIEKEDHIIKDGNVDTESLRQTIDWMKQQGLIKHEIKCNKCNVKMNWTKCRSVKDRFVWKCQNKHCVKYKRHISIRTESFFFNSHIELTTWKHVMYLWSVQESIENTCKQTNIGRPSLVDAYKSLREICGQYFLRHPVQIGGPGVAVQIGESCFSHEVKHQQGKRKPQEPIWVFGIIDASTNPTEGYMEIVDSRDPGNLLPIINKVVRPGSIIYSDKWRLYRESQSVGNNREAVNSLVNFVDISGMQIKAIEPYWNKHKCMIKNMKGCRRELLNSYLNQMMWQDRFRDNAFLKLCEHIKDYYRDS